MGADRYYIFAKQTIGCSKARVVSAGSTPHIFSIGMAEPKLRPCFYRSFPCFMD